MVRIEDVVIKTLLSIQRVVGSSSRKLKLHPRVCFELFGFDILVDEDLKPWILEVNLSPSLNCDAPVDSILKTNLLCDTLNLACVPLVAERNLVNRAYILSRQSPSIDEISNGVSSTSVSTNNLATSASASPSTVDSGYDGNVRITRSPPRKRTTLRATKLRRSQQQFTRVCFQTILILLPTHFRLHIRQRRSMIFTMRY
jgi:hypothetical protein